MSTNSKAFNLDRFRVTASSGTALKVFIPKNVPFMIHPDAAMHSEEVWLGLYENKWYLVDVDVAECRLVFPNVSFKRAELFLGVQQDGSLFFVPVTHPTGIEYFGWRESMLKILKVAESNWINMKSDPDTKRFIGRILVGKTDVPKWPSKDLTELLKIAFRNRVIDESHPSLEGAYSREVVEDFDE